MTYKFNTTNNTAFDTNLDYVIDLSKYFNNNNNTKSNDFTSDILNKIRSIFPWANKDNKNEIITIESIPIDSYTILDITPEALNFEWNKAASRLYDYIYYTNHPSYDFKIGGIPIKIHGNYIQIGSKIVPKFTTSKFFNSLSKKERILMYSISLSINSIEIAA